MPLLLPLDPVKASRLLSADQATPANGFGATPRRDPRTRTSGLGDSVPIVLTVKPEGTSALIAVNAMRGPSGTGAAEALASPPNASASATQPRLPTYRNTAGILHYSAKSGSSASSLISVSASSAAGSEPA